MYYCMHVCTYCTYLYTLWSCIQKREQRNRYMYEVILQKAFQVGCQCMCRNCRNKKKEKRKAYQGCGQSSSTTVIDLRFMYMCSGLHATSENTYSCTIQASIHTYTNMYVHTRLKAHPNNVCTCHAIYVRTRIYVHLSSIIAHVLFLKKINLN